MNYLIFKGHERFVIGLIEEALKNDGIRCRVVSGDMGGIYGGLGFMEETLIYVDESTKEQALLIVEHILNGL